PGGQEHKAQGAAEPRLRHGVILRPGGSISIIVAWLLPAGSRALRRLGSLRGLGLPRLRRPRNLRLLRLPRLRRPRNLRLLRLPRLRRLFIGTFALDRTYGDRLVLSLGRKWVPKEISAVIDTRNGREVPPGHEIDALTLKCQVVDLRGR